LFGLNFFSLLLSYCTL